MALAVVTGAATVTTGMPAWKASSMTAFMAVGEPGIEMMTSTPFWIIERICWIWVGVSPLLSVTMRSFTRPSFLYFSTFFCSSARAAARQALPENELL